ncbi:MAG: ABC transporter substrate-binding protein [Gammaproteobacteria bacterium]
MANSVHRRTVLKGVAAVAAGSSLGFPYIAKGATPLVVNSYGGSFEKFMRDQIVAPFEKETGIEIKLDVNLGKGWLANLRAAGPENPPYDVLMTNETWASIEREEGFFEPISEASVPNLKDVWPMARYPDDMAVIGTLAPIGLCYRTDLVKAPPASWTDLWTNAEFKGKTGMYTITNSAGYMFVLMTAKNYFGSEYEVDKAVDKIAELKPFNQVDFSGTMETVLSRGEAIIGPIDFPAAARLKRKGVKVDVVAPKEGVFMFDQVFNVLKGSKNKEAGYQWIDYILRPDVQLKWVRNYFWSPVNKNVTVPEDLREAVPIAGEKMSSIIVWDWKTANANRDKVIERWNKTMR